MRRINKDERDKLENELLNHGYNIVSVKSMTDISLMKEYDAVVSKRKPKSIQTENIISNYDFQKLRHK